MAAALVKGKGKGGAGGKGMRSRKKAKGCEHGGHPVAALLWRAACT